MLATKRPKFQVVWNYIVFLKVRHDPTDKYEQKGMRPLILTEGWGWHLNLDHDQTKLGKWNSMLRMSCVFQYVFLIKWNT